MNALSTKIVVLGADHNGTTLKREIKKLLGGLGYSCVDIGPHDENEKVDYVDYASTVGKIVNDGEARWGVLICGTGAGMSMVANRFPNVRASLVHSTEVAKKTREHNDANVLCLGAWVNSPEENLKITSMWFGEPFKEGRHVKRVEKTKARNKEKIVFTNGVFDILTLGHIEHLKFSKLLGGKLIVGINSDHATKLLKGEGHPVHNEQERKMVVESLSFVDEVIIFDDIKTINIVQQIHPDVVSKGAEWTSEEVRKRDQIPPEIEVVVSPLPTKGKYSSTEIANKIRKRSKGDFE